RRGNPTLLICLSFSLSLSLSLSLFLSFSFSFSPSSFPLKLTALTILLTPLSFEVPPPSPPSSAHHTTRTALTGLGLPSASTLSPSLSSESESNTSAA
ncbi:hypothetical protein IWX46DRAFT_616876, partial [Phyllosticta citricarpa]